MKHTTLFFLLFITTTASFAQKIKIKDGIAYAGDSAYCKVHGNKGIAAAAHAEFTISNMQDEELMLVYDVPNEPYYEISFFKTGEKVKLDALKVGNNTKGNFIKLLYKSKVIINNDIDAGGKKNFLLRYASDPEMVNRDIENAGSGSEIVQRDNTAEIIIANGTIRQDGKIVGSIKSQEYTNDNAVMMRRYKIYLPDNTQVAELSVEEFSAEKNKLLTIKDNRMTTVAGVIGSVVIKEEELLEKAVNYLVGRKYL